MSNVFVLRHFDGEWPTRVELVILAADRYEATEKANEYREAIYAPLVEDEDVSEVAGLFEHDDVEAVYRV